MFNELAMLAIHNLLRARARLAMTAGGVLVGTSAVILLIALTIGLQNAAEQGFGNNASLTEITMYPSWSPNPDSPAPKLDTATVALISRLKGVSAVIPMLNLEVGGQLESGKLSGYTQVIGIDSRLLSFLGLSLTDGALSLASGTVLAGAQVGANFFDPKSENYEPQSIDLLKDPVKLFLYDTNSNERKITLKINGIFSSVNYDYAVFMPIEDVIKWREWASGQPFDRTKFEYSQIIVRASTRETTDSVATALRELGYNVSSMGDFLKELNGFFSTMRLMLGGVGGVALLVAAFGVANTMTMAILERTREIGLMKAVGATDGNVLTVFLIEAGLVGLSGGVSGVGVSLLLQSIINEAVKNAPQSQQGSGAMFLPVDLNALNGQLVVIPVELMLFALALSTSVGLIAGLYPALRASRMTTVLALKTD